MLQNSRGKISNKVKVLKKRMSEFNWRVSVGKKINLRLLLCHLNYIEECVS
jgi:hypothetical protein